jgi:HNH endonuclease
MSRTPVPAWLRERVAAQSRHRCGYCLTAEAITGTPLVIDHLIPEALGGPTEEANLWLACCVAASASCRNVAPKQKSDRASSILDGRQATACVDAEP